MRHVIVLKRGEGIHFRSLGSFTLSPEQGRYALSGLTLVLLIVLMLVTVYSTTFIQGDQVLAFKTAFILLIGITGIAGMALLAVVLFVNGKEVVFTFNTEMSGKVLAIGAFVTLGLIATQIATVAFIPPNTTVAQGVYSASPQLSAVAPVFGFSIAQPGATINPNAQYVSLFYTSAAIAETFAFQGAMYTILIGVATRFTYEVGWKHHLPVSAIVGGAAGVNHFAVFQLSLSSVLAAALGFMVLNFAYEVTDSIDVAAIGHILLNLLSSLGAASVVVISVFPTLSAAVGLAASVVFVGFLAVKRGAVLSVIYERLKPSLNELKLPLPRGVC